MKTLFAADLLLSMLAFALYAWDKQAARRRARRVSERTLLLVTLLGGWPGALVSQTVLRHKTAKASFRRAFRCTVALNLIVNVVAIRLL